MPLDPRQPPGLDPTSRLYDRVAALERQLQDLQAQVNGGAASAIPVVAALPTAGRKGRLVFLSSDGKVYKDTGTTWANPL